MLLVHFQGKMKTRMHHVSDWLCLWLCAFVCRCVCMCKHASAIRTFIIMDSALLVCTFISVSVCVFMPQACVVLFCWQSIEQPSSGCSWDDAIRTLFLEVCACACVSVAADQCGSNHPTGAAWSPITLFKQLAQPDTQTLWCLTDYWITSCSVHQHSARLHAVL